jgi:hypothetical protein
MLNLERVSDSFKIADRSETYINPELMKVPGPGAYFLDQKETTVIIYLQVIFFKSNALWFYFQEVFSRVRY